MAVEDRAGGVADRVVQVVALDEHGVEAGDAADVGRRRPARAAGAAGRTPTAGSRGWRAARRPTGRPRAGPCAKRVRLSIISRTSLALVAEPLGDAGGGEGGAQPHQRAARRRWRRRRPSGPGPRGRGRSRGTRGPHGRARRPGRAPRPWASVPRAIIDSRVDLPTPEPAKMPSRWPRPQRDEGVERAHAERQRGRSTRPGAAGAAAAPSTVTVSTTGAAGAAVDRAPEPVERRGRAGPRPTRIVRRAAGASTPGRRSAGPRRSPSGMHTTPVARRTATTSAAATLPVAGDDDDGVADGGVEARRPRG